MSKRMTLVIGAACSDGLFFCSDTEEGTVMGGKRSVKKLFDEGAESEWHLVLGTAGFGPLCDLAAKRICHAAHTQSQRFLAEHERIIGDELKKIYDQYIPDNLPDWKRLDRQISLVIGIIDYSTRQQQLYQTYEEILQPVNHRFACAGVGQEIANYYLDRLFQDFRGPRYSGVVPRLHEAERPGGPPFSRPGLAGEGGTRQFVARYLRPRNRQVHSNYRNALD